MRSNRQKYEPLLRRLQSPQSTVKVRTVACPGGTVWVLYIKQLLDVEALAEQVIKPLTLRCENAFTKPQAKKVAESVLYTADCWVETNEDSIEAHVYGGMAVLLFSHDDAYIVVNLRQIAHRSIPTPEITYSVRGPKDSFVENLEVNLSLIRYRIKDPNLRIDTFELGRRTKTPMAVIYLQDVANETAVTEIENRIRRIDTDAIWGTGDIQNFLSNTKHDLFPQMGITERSDAACEAIVEGKVLLLADGGQIALVAPHTFSESMMTCDDRYDNKIFGLFSRLIRYLAYFIALCSSSVYVALVSFHTDALPGSYAILLAQLRQNVLFPAMVEVLIVETIAELVREALLRVPTKIGTAIGIVGAIIIGQAATAAGIFDSLLLIIVSASLLASFAVPDYFSMHPVRILKFLLIFMTGIMGFYGFILAMSFVLISLVSIDSFGVPYFAPFAPFNRYDFKRAFIFSRSTSAKRMQYMKTKDDTRSSTVPDSVETNCQLGSSGGSAPGGK